jgi:glycosyltransferase involved in cell wall biosynthesis
MAEALWYSSAVRILVDYRPALRERTGVGEYVHELVAAYTSLPEAQPDRMVLFTSSWKDRPAESLGHDLRATVVDRQIPVSVLNFAWHRLEAPAVERLAGDVDVVHSQHPLLIPAKRAAQVVTIHDLFFLSEPNRTRAEIRRDYAELAPRHARRAHAVLTSSRYSAGRIERELGVVPDRIYVCPPGPPRWRNLGRAPHVPAKGYVLFLGTLEPRKNIGVLLDAYTKLIQTGTAPPRLVLAGRATTDATGWLDRIRRAPLVEHVEHRGYVPAHERESLYEGARLLVMPSLDEGFGLPALEAMSAGVPVVASNRGSLPEVLGDAGPLIDPEDAGSLADAIRRMVEDEVYARACATRGLAQAQTFSWPRTARVVRQMYVDAMNRR